MSLELNVTGYITGYASENHQCLADDMLIQMRFALANTPYRPIKETAYNSNNNAMRPDLLVRHEDTLEVLIAIEIEKGLTDSIMKGKIRDMLSRYHYPKELFFVEMSDVGSFGYKIRRIVKLRLNKALQYVVVKTKPSYSDVLNIDLLDMAKDPILFSPL